MDVKVIRKKYLGACLFALGISLIVSGAGHAQPKEEPTPEAIIEKMKKDVGINDAQAAQILPIITADMKKRKILWGQLKESGFSSHKTYREQMQKMDQERDASLANYLSPEQMQKIKQKQQAGKNNKKNNGPRSIGGDFPVPGDDPPGNEY